MRTVSPSRYSCRRFAIAAILLLLCGSTPTWGQSAVAVRGVVRTGSGEPVAGAAVTAPGARITARTDAEGGFQIELSPGSHTLRISHPGYADLSWPVEVGTTPVSLDLVVSVLRFREDVTVSAVRAPAEAPISKRDMSRGEIEARNYGQEMPFLLEQVPSVTQYSDSGAQGGYSYLYLRGIPQTRMNVTIDGMPINEPEDSAFYFSNLGDLANAVDSIQVQRGVGTSSVGAASFVGSINFASAALTDRPEAVVRLGGGGFGSRRVSASVNSGSIGRGVKLYAQSAAQDSDGFRHHSGSKQRSLYLAMSRETGASYLKVFGFLGRERSELAYLAADEASLAADLRTNPLTAEERDRFDQRFVTGQYHRALGERTGLTVQGFYNGADGWYRVRSGAAEPSGLFQYGLTWHNAGAAANFQASTATTDFTWGVYFSDFESRHARDIVDGSFGYVNRGYKNEVNTFAKLAWSSGRWKYFGDVQARWARFRYAGGLDLGSVSWTFVNPKVGARFDAGHGVSLYASLGRAEREPARSDMLQGEDNATVRHDLSAVRPEEVVDAEIGANLAYPGFTAQVNGYLMAFHHEIAQTGELSEIGLPLRRNVDRSSRRGIEVDLTWRPAEPFQVRHTATFSRSRIHTWTQFYDVYDPDGVLVGSTSRTHRDVPPYVTPAILATLSGEYTPAAGTTVGATWKYVGESHLDNTGSPDMTAPGFMSVDFDAAAGLSRVLRFAAAAHPVLRVHVNNLLDNRRMFPNGYSYQFLAGAPDPAAPVVGTRYFYPLATRSAFVSLELRF